VERLLLNELGQASLSGLERGISELPTAVRAKLSVHPGSAESMREILTSADTVIADPPRKGLDQGLLDALIDAPPERFIYVSCGLQSFLRDAQRLLDSKRFALRELTAYALIPFTEHVETLALFERSAVAE
jgi:tRNA/tmRNA/rRNA uracil-C5-methylase (TrmA/RlmC/RlmD family)